jgi:hypothetical protein
MTIGRSDRVIVLGERLQLFQRRGGRRLRHLVAARPALLSGRLINGSARCAVFGRQLHHNNRVI